MVKRNEMFKVNINGVDYMGTMSEISYQFCKNNEIQLYIEPDARGESYELFAEFSHNHTNVRGYIASFEGRPNTIINALELFFTEFICDNYKDYAVAEETELKKVLNVLRHDEEYKKHLQRAEERINTLLCEHGYNFRKETE